MGEDYTTCRDKIRDVLSGASWSGDLALDCVKSIGSQTPLHNDAVAVLQSVFSRDIPLPIDSRLYQHEARQKLEVLALQILVNGSSSDVTPYCVSVLDRETEWLTGHEYDVSDSAPKRISEVLEIAEKSAGQHTSVSESVLHYFERMIPLLPGAGRKHWDYESSQSAVKVGTTCCAIIGETRPSGAAPVLSKVLGIFVFDTALLEAAIAALGQIGTSEAITLICGVFPRRDNADLAGYHDSRHDALCGKATAAVVQIGTLDAFSEFARQIDMACRTLSDYPWLSDVRSALKQPMSDEARANLIRALVLYQVSDTTRIELISGLPRNSDTLRTLVEVNQARQEESKWANEQILRLSAHIEHAKSQGDEPGKKSYLRIEYPSHLDQLSATRFQSLFTRSGLPAVGKRDVDLANGYLNKVGLPDLGESSKESIPEIPLTRLKIDYPYVSHLAHLKLALIPRSEVGANWVYIENGISDGTYVYAGQLLLTSLRLIVIAEGLGDTLPAPGKEMAAKNSSVGMALLRDISGVAYESNVIELKFSAYYGVDITWRLNLSYPGASVLSGLMGVSLPGATTEDLLRSSETRASNNALRAKRVAAESALHELFTFVLESNLRSGGLTVTEIG